MRFRKLRIAWSVAWGVAAAADRAVGAELLLHRRNMANLFEWLADTCLLRPGSTRRDVSRRTGAAFAAWVELNQRKESVVGTEHIYEI